MGFYDGTKLLSMKDINGKTPEIYMATTNRTGGKTTYFGRWVVNRWLKHGEEFGLIYRFKYELEDISAKFFNDIKGLFFEEHDMSSKIIEKGLASELRIDDKVCGYALALNSADAIKKQSHRFSKIVRLLFDEFQSETNTYCDDEVKKFRSIHTSIARGNGKQVRYVPVIMISNPVTILNPYYISMGISTRLTDEVNFLRGDGFVLEQGYNESACVAQKESGFNRAFGNDDYGMYSSEGVYLNDNKTFIERPDGKSRYIATLKYKGGFFAIREYADCGLIYCDDKPDLTFPFKITITTDDHQINYVMLKNNDLFLMKMRYYFEHGCFRFKDLRCKEALLTSLSY